MDSIFAKFILLIASLFNVLGGISYIQTSQDSLTFDFKTGDSYPIYHYLQTQNIGPYKVRFDISSDVSWIYVYREGQSQVTSLELPNQAVINFILEVHPENLSDGQHLAKVTVKAVNLSDYTVMDSEEIEVILNKNVVEETPLATPEPEASVSPITTPSPIPSAELDSILNQLKSIFDSLRLLLINFFGA